MSKNLKWSHLNNFKIGMNSNQTFLKLHIRYKSNSQIGNDMKLNTKEKFQFTIFEMTCRSSTLKVPNLLANAQRVSRKWIFQKIMCLLNKYLNQMVLCAGIFFILPCIDNYARVDLRTRTYDVPPQEVSLSKHVCS